MANPAGSNNPVYPSVSGRPVIFGEVLFDEFEDGTAVMGGAPFNVAWHLQGFGLQPKFITRIGKDPHGEQVRQTMAAWNMDRSGVQTDNEHPTGRVSIQLNKGQPTFNIIPDQAYDFIEFDADLADSLQENCALLYHGSLIARNAQSRHSLESYIKQTDLNTFVDVNLRNPWWDKTHIRDIIQRARWAKVNDAELAQVLDQTAIPNAQLEQAIATVRNRHELDLLIVTLGADGAYFATENTTLFGEPVPVKNMVDTVGAGDAFSAVTIFGLIQHWPLQAIINRALDFASAICGIRGATTSDPSLYKFYLNKWRE
jgi:fructokinase